MTSPTLPQIAGIWNWLCGLFAPSPIDELAPMRAGMAAMIRRAQELGCDEVGTSLAITTFGCRIRQERVGDWEFTVRKLAPSDRTHLLSLGEGM